MTTTICPMNRAMTIISEQLSILISYQMDHIYSNENKYNKQQLSQMDGIEIKYLQIILHLFNQRQININKNQLEHFFNLI